MSTIASTFEMLRARHEAALIPYLMVGYPSMEGTRELLHVLVEAGADMVELGIPFSDPMADGATLQRVNHLALEAGGSLRSALELVSDVRTSTPVPLVFMSYYNPILRMGEARFASEASAAGVDGVIVPDLPLEEAGCLANECAGSEVDVVGMVAPTTPGERVSAIADRATGFLYCVSLKGVTGARSELSRGVEELVNRVRSRSALPVAVGFGISLPDHVRRVASCADGVIVASALLDRIDRSGGKPVEAARAFVAELKSACRRPPRAERAI